MEVALLALAIGAVTAGLAAVKWSQPPALVPVRVSSRRRRARR